MELLRRNLFIAFSAISLLQLTSPDAGAQGFGPELHNNLMPRSGGMAGVSIARPQDLQSAINANPSTMAQFFGTQFSFSGSWAEPTINVQHAGGVLPGVGAYSAKSEAEGLMIGNIAVMQDLRAMGLPGTMGVGLIAAGGGGVSFRDVPASNGTSALISLVNVAAGAGVELTDNLSAGATLTIGNSSFDGPFLGLTAAAYDYALRGSIGLDYDLACNTTVGFYYQTKQRYNYDDAVRLQLPVGFDVIRDIDADLPENIGFGIANDTLMCRNLLLAVDVLYKQWDDAALFKALYENQWAVQIGAQYQWNPKVQFRLGYAWAENAMISNAGSSAGGVAPPGAQAAIQYIQALFPNINEHRISAGVTIHELMPNVDFDLFAGGMFDESDDFGLSSVDFESYWVGAGMTWHFGAKPSCDCEGECEGSCP